MSESRDPVVQRYLPTVRLPDAQELWGVFHYDPDTGVLRHRLTGAVYTGDIRVAITGRGGTAIRRIIWRMMTGDEAFMIGESVDGDKRNHRWENLRAVVDAPARSACHGWMHHGAGED